MHSRLKLGKKEKQGSPFVLLLLRRPIFVCSLPPPELRQGLERIFKDRFMEHFGAETDSLSLAARIVAATVTVDPWMTATARRCDLEALLCMQVKTCHGMTVGFTNIDHPEP